MITAAGAGAAYCAVTPQRLRPKNARSPRVLAPVAAQPGVPSPFQPHPHLPRQPQVQETSGQSPFLQSLLLNRTRTNASSAARSASPPSIASQSLLDGDELDARSLHSVREDNFFRAYQSPAAFHEYGEPPSPKSFYSAATSSSGGTARVAHAGRRNSYDSIPPLPAGDLHSNAPKDKGSIQKLRETGFLDLSGDLHPNAPRTRDPGPASYSAKEKGYLNDRATRGEKTVAEIRRDSITNTTNPREVCIAVVGASGTGKSTFIQKAFDLKVPPSKNVVYSRALPLGSVLYDVRLVELDWRTVEFDTQPIRWPRTEDGEPLPYVDGALLLYDVTNESTVIDIPKILSSFAKSGIPSLLVSCKADAPASARRVEPGSVESIGAYGGIETLQTSLTASPETQRKCILSVVNMVMARRSTDKNGRFHGTRRRANSTTGENPRQPSPRPSTARSGHSRASSEFAGTFLKDYSPTQPSTQRQRPSVGPTSSFGSTLQVGSQTLPLNTPLLDFSYANDARRGHRADSFLDMDDETIGDPDDVPILEREGSILEDDEDGKNSRTNGFTWDELIDRLLGETMSRSDKDFITIFLCFYRKIAPPGQLLDSILSRFEKVGDTERIILQRIESQTRYCQVLLQWITNHPGDFAYPITRHKLQNFVNAISGNRSFALLAREMSQAMVKVVEDEDACWGRTDNEVERASSMSSFVTGSSTLKDSSSTSTNSDDFAKSLDNTLHVPPFDDRRPSEAPSHLSISSMSSAMTGSTGRDQYSIFMGIKEEEIATELTRIDWSEFSKIRPRDLVRHVSIAPDLKEKCESLQHVNRMISHFNHVAYWVANIILERPKAKHRARALEKFMTIAWLLRHRNNYNALGAVIAGINGTAVHRLSLTRELVNQETHRKFMRLELLMSTHKSHFAYRLAWENTSQQRIPFLPLHRRDLVSADEGNRTFVNDGDRINWNKFQVMGEVLTVITKAQITPYPNLQRNTAVEKLILDAVLNTNDDDLYERSVQLESSNGGQTDSSKRKRIWFQR